MVKPTRKMKLKGTIFKEHSDKLGLLWTNDQWQTVIDAMDEYANQTNAAQRLQDFKEGFSAAIDTLIGANNSIQKRQINET